MITWEMGPLQSWVHPPTLELGVQGYFWTLSRAVSAQRKAGLEAGLDWIDSSWGRAGWEVGAPRPYIVSQH